MIQGDLSQQGASLKIKRILVWQTLNSLPYLCAKFQSMRTLTGLLIVLLTITACKNANKEQPEAPKPIESKLNEEGTHKLMNVLADYYSLKNALVASDGTEAIFASEKLTKTAADFHLYMAADSAAAGLVDAHLDSVTKASMAISTTAPDGIEQMRASFESVSNNLYALLQKVELKNASVYHQYCPMAFNDKGAYWISNENEIKNPYFGKKMLTCGEVTDSLK